MNVLVTGSQGFIGSYICEALLAQGYHVLGVDNFSKYGYLKRKHDDHSNFTFKRRDLSDRFDYPADWPVPDYIIACASRIGGISYFHKYAYELLAENERIIANTYDWAISMKVKKVLVLSSSMVFENTDSFPSHEEDVFECPPPSSSYGFQKLAVEYFAKAALEQHGIPYTIIRPFNCVGIGEEDAFEGTSHVLPDLIAKVIKGQDPLEIYGNGEQVRCYTHGKDIARAVAIALIHPNAENETFNISTPKPTKVLELAQMVWDKMNPHKEFKWKSIGRFEHDVQLRWPEVSKAAELLDFRTEISLEDSVDEVIDYMSKLV